MKNWINDKKQWIDWTWKSDEKWEKHRIEITQKTPDCYELINEWMNERLNELINEWMNDWMNETINKWNY